jgi:hypothetical protein
MDSAVLRGVCDAGGIGWSDTTLDGGVGEVRRMTVLLPLLESLWQYFFGAYEGLLGADLFWSLIFSVLAFGVYLKTENFMALAFMMLLPGALLSTLLGEVSVLFLIGVSLVLAYIIFKVFYKGRGW